MRRGTPRRPGRARCRRAAPVAALLLAFVATAGCGQRGPLTLPDSARPIERLDPAERPQPNAESARPGASPGGAAPTQRGEEDDEADDARDEAAENER